MVTATGRLCGLTVLIVASVVSAATPAGAQPDATGWSVSLIAGSLVGGDLGPGELEPTYAGAVGLGVGGGFSLEAEVAAIPELQQFGDIDLALVTGGVLYHPFRLGRVTPYGVLGASLARIATTTVNRRTALEVAVDMGGGAWLRVAGPVAIRGDVRFIHIDNAPNFWRAGGGITVAL
jgi:hypothetical protein